MKSHVKQYVILVMLTMLTLSACSVIEKQETQKQNTQKTIIFDASKYNDQSKPCPKVTEQSYQACAVKSGTLKRQGILGCYGCVIKYEDAGKTCRDHSDCKGRCYAVGGYALNTPATGKCSVDNSPFGCRQEVVNGKAGSMLCVD